MDTAERVKSQLATIAPSLPENVVITYPYDTTPFVQLSIEKVVHTLLEAIVWSSSCCWCSCRTFVPPSFR